MPTVRDMAQVVRSKNAGPFHLTLDIMLPDAAAFRRARSAPALAAPALAALYGIDPADLQVIYYEPALAIKITMRRPVPSGDPGDLDVFGAQQHAPLLDLEIP